jgi:crotonobetainyl-CoA:carnitine CoA-transferase CaiB-like acyl-CoA transferase
MRENGQLMSHLPYAGVRIVEASATLSGRIVGLLFADQGAAVRCSPDTERTGHDVDDYLDRGKQKVDAVTLADSGDADIVIVDGDTPVDRRPAQIVLRVTAALPGDQTYGHLPADCSEDLLSATLGFFTDMAIIGRPLGRPVIYSPLPVSSVYTGVIAAIAVAAALTQRLKTGRGTEIVAARLAGGLAAIGALALTSIGLDPHLAPATRAAVPAGMTPDQFAAILDEAAQRDELQSWLEHRMIPFGVPYRASDGRMVIVINGVNRRSTRRLLQHLGIWDRLLEAGLVDVSPYTPASVDVRGRNLADSPTLNFASASLVAELLEEIIATKTAAQWEAEFCGLGVAAAKVMSLQEWLHDAEARRGGLTAQLAGTDRPQIGRAAWLASAQPYPALDAAERSSGPRAAADPPPTGPAGTAGARPLDGCIVVDLTNVIAGPNCARMLGELGATVYRIEQPEPSHPPIAMTTWGAEAGAGKRSIILDVLKPDGKAVLERLLRRADFVVVNKSDAQCVRLGIDREALQRVNPKAILVQMTAHHGERVGARHDYPGYDPTGQAITGIMMRFGTERCPTYHGLASCVDYLCGYLGTWAATTALFARERRGDGRGDWAQTSLTAAASLMQLLFQFNEPPPTARGPHATGPSATHRVYRLADGWIYALGTSDLTEPLHGQTVASALARLKADGIEAIRVNTVRELADRHRAEPSRTIHFQAQTRDGWATECFVPTWFCFDGAVPASRQSAARIGSDADAILAEAGYAPEAIGALKSGGAVLPVEWARRPA